MVKRKRIVEDYGVPYLHSSGSSSYRSRSGGKRQKTIVLAPDSQPPSQPTFVERASSAALGAAVGYATGGPVGAAGAAIDGAINPLRFYQNKNMPTTKQRVVNRLVNKSAMIKTGKARVKKVKPVKVSPYLKKAVKQVMKGQEATGFYQRTWTGLIGTMCAVGTADYSVFSTQLGVSTNAVLAPSTQHNSDPKTWFSSTFAETFTAGVEAAATPTVDGDFNFFTPGKIWHAASVLFNNKPENRDPYSSLASNIKTTFVDATGALTPSTPGQLEIFVKHSKVEFTFKNVSNRTLEVDIYECVSNLKFAQTMPLENAILSAVQLQDGTNDNMIGYYSGGAVRTTSNSVLLEGSVDGLALIKGNGFQWKYVKRTMVLQPQEICMHSMDGPSGMLQFKKLLLNSAYQTAVGYKDWSKHVLISVRPDSVLKEVASSTPTFTNQGNRIVNQTTATSGILHSPITVEVSESYRIAVPEVAGFVTAAGAAGSSQPLGLRKPKIQITHIGPDNEVDLNTRLFTAREENPVATSTSSL